jgi:hypothetical protein
MLITKLKIVVTGGKKIPLYTVWQLKIFKVVMAGIKWIAVFWVVAVRGVDSLFALWERAYCRLLLLSGLKLFWCCGRERKCVGYVGW